MEQNAPNSGRLMTWFQEVTVPAADLLRSVIPPDQLTYVAFSCLGLGMIFFCATLLSFLRIRYSIKRDGKSAPALTYLGSPVDYFLLCSRSQKSLKKRMEAEAKIEGGTTSHYGYLSTTEALPYVKPIDRFLARATYLLLLSVILLLILDWLYPGYTYSPL